MAVQRFNKSKDQVNGENPKNYKQPDTVKVTEEENTEKEKDQKGSNEIVTKQTGSYPRDLDVIRYERAKRKGEFSNHKQVRFDPNEPLDQGFKSAFDKKVLPNIMKDIQANKTSNQEKYISPLVKENLESDKYESLKALKAREEKLQTRTAFGKANEATRNLNKMLDKDLEGSILEQKEDDNFVQSMAKGFVGGLLNIKSVIGGVAVSSATPGMSEEEEQELSKVKRRIREIEDPIVKQDYSILKSQNRKTEDFLESLVTKKQEKDGFFSSGENEDWLFRDAELLNRIKELNRKTEAEYESRFNNEGWWGGFTEDAPDMFNTMMYLQLSRFADENPENMSPAQKAFLKSYAKYEEVKGLNLNSNSAYRFFRDSFRPSVDFVGEIALTRNAGKAIGTAGLISKTGKAAPVFKTIANTAAMPATTTNALKNDASNIQVIEHLDGQKQLFTTDTQKLTAVSNLAKEKAELDYKIQRLQSKPNLSEAKEKELEGHLLMREGFNNMLNQLVDEKGELRSPQRSLAAEFGKSAYETSKELLAERLGGRLDKYMPSFGNLSLMRMNSKWKSKIRKADDILFNSNHAGKMSKALYGHIKPGTYIHSLPSEMIEELGVQIAPSFNIDYADQVSEFANPDFYLNIAYSTVLMQAGFGAGGGALQQGKMIVDKDYRTLVRERKNILKDLRGYYREIDQAMTDEDLAKEISMASVGTMFKDLDYRAKIADLRNPEKNTKGEDQKDRDKKANLLEETKFINAAVMAVQTGTDAELKQALTNLIKKKDISPETKKNVLKGLGHITELKGILKRNGSLIDAGAITDTEIRTLLMKDQKKKLDAEKEDNAKELGELEAEFIEQSEKYDAIPLDVGPLTEEARNKATAYAKEFTNFLEKKGRKNLMQKRYDLEGLSKNFGEAIGNFEQKAREWKSEEYQTKRKQDKARAATTKKQFDAYKDSLSDKEREEREALYTKKNPKKAVQDYNKKKDFKNEKKTVPDEVDTAAQDLANPKPNKPKFTSPKKSNISIGESVTIDGKKYTKVETSIVGEEKGVAYQDESGMSYKAEWVESQLETATKSASTQPTEAKKAEIELKNKEKETSFEKAGKETKEKNDGKILGQWILDNAKEGDTIVDEDGNGYEVTEIGRDGGVILTPFEINEKGNKEYNPQGLRRVSKVKLKQGDLFEYSYFDLAGNQVIKQYKYNAKYDAELEALEESTSQSNQSIESKKDEIERKRQEELSVKDSESELVSQVRKIFEDNGTPLREDRGAEWIGNRLEPGSSVVGQLPKQKQAEVIAKATKISKKEYGLTIQEAKEINAKYDAELKALEEQDNQQEKPTQEELARENSGAISAEDLMEAKRLAEERYSNEEEALSPRQMKPDDTTLKIFQKLYSKVKGATGKANPGTKDIVQYLVERHGWDDVSDGFLGYVRGFEMIGVDMSDANDIYSQYDDIDNIALRAAKKLSKGEKPKPANLTEQDTKETTQEVDDKKESQLREKSTIKIDGEEFNDRRTDATQTKMALTTVDRKRFGPTIFVNGDTLVTDDVIDNHFILDPDFIKEIEVASEQNPGSVSLSLLDFSDGVVRKNNSPNPINITLEVRVDSGNSMGEYSLPVNIEPGDEYTLGQLRQDLKDENYSQDVIDEYVAMYSPMVYSYNDKAISYAHNLYWYSDQAQSLNSEMSQEDKEMARENVRTLRRQVVGNGNKIPVSIVGSGKMALNEMNDENGNVVRKKVSEVIGEVKGYDDPNIGKIGVLQKRDGEVKVIFNDGSTISIEDIADDIMGSEKMKPIREGKAFDHVQIFESQLGDKPYRLNYLNDENMSGQYNPIAKDSFTKVMFAQLYLRDNIPSHVKSYLESEGLNISRAKDIIGAVGNTETFYDAMNYGGNKKAKNHMNNMINSENLSQLTGIVNNLKNKELAGLKTHYYYQKQVFSIPVFEKGSFNFEEKSYQEFAREIFTTKNRTYDIQTAGGKTKTIFSISPQIYTQPLGETETDIQYESGIVGNTQEISNPETEQTPEEISNDDKIREEMKERGYDQETIDRLINSIKQQRGDDAYSPRQLSEKSNSILNSLDTGKIEDITTIQERVISQNIIHKVALKITEGNFNDLGNKILELVDETIDTIQKEKQDFYEILSLNDSTYTREAKENLDFINAVSRERVKLYNKAIKTFNDTIDAEIESIDDNTDVQQWAQDLESREVTTRLSDKLKMVFYGIPKKRIQKGDVIQSFGLEEYHSPIDIFNKIKDIMTEVDGNWEDVIQQLNNKYKEYGYPIYNDIRNKLNSLDEKLQNNMLHAMTSYKATYFKIDITSTNDGMHNVRLLDENDTRKSITIVNDLKSSFKRIFGVSENNRLNPNTKLISNLITDIDKLDSNALKVKKFFDKMGLTEINVNTWNHFIKGGKLPQIAGIFKNELQKLSKVKGPLQTKDNIFDNLNKQLRTLAKIESELNHSLVGSTKRIGEKPVSSTLPPTMVYDLNRKFISKEEMDRNRNNPFIANGYIFKLLDQTKNEELSKNLKEQMQRLGLPSLEVLKLNKKLVGRDNKYTKQGELEHFVFRAGLYTSKLNTLNLTSLALGDYKSLNFRARYLTGLTIADKSRTYIQSLPTLDLAKSGLRIGAGNVLEYSTDLENFLTDNLFETQLRAIIKYYQKDAENPYTNKDDNKAFYFIKALNTMEYDGENIHDYLKYNYESISEDTIQQLKTTALPILKSYIRNELKQKMEKFPEAYKFIDSTTLKSYDGKTNQDKYKNFLAEYVINTTLGNMFSFQAYMKHPSFYGGMNVSKIENKSDIREWNQSYKKFKAKVHKRTALLIAPGNIFANSKNKKIGHIALRDVERYSDQIVEIIEQSYARDSMTTEQEQQLQTLKNLIESVKNLQSKDSLTDLEYEQLRENRKSILDIKDDFKNVEGYFQLNAADAQMYVTYKGYLDMLVGEGKIDEKQKQDYIKKIEDDSLTEAELKELAQINLQPKKPVYSYDKYDPILGESVPVYIKNSVFPLFPGLTANIKLDKLRQGMEAIENKQGMPVYASYESANKIGHKATNITMENVYDSNGNIPDLESGYSELDLRGMRLQQATPSKEDRAFQEGQDAKQTLGSQMFKLLMGNNVNRIQDKIFPNLFQTIDNKEEMLSGEEVDKIFFNLYEKYNNTQRNKLESELGVTDMEDFYSMSLDQQKEIVESLRGILKREVISRNYPESVLQNLNNIVEDGFVGFESPFLFDSNSYKFEALLQAIVANRLIIHKLPGNSHVVGSSEGFVGDNTLTNKQRSEIVYFDKDTYTNGLKSNITKNGKLQKAQVFIKPHFSYTNKDGEYVYVDFTDPKYYKEEDGVKVLNMDMIDPELLTYFSFRIPTSSHQSGALLEVGGFLPSSSQDLLIVPAEHTEQIGEDYDVDARKLYKNNYFVDNDGKVMLLKPEYVDALAERDAEGLDRYLETQEKIAIMKEELKGLTINWEAFNVDYQEIKEYKTSATDNLFRAIFQENYSEVENIFEEALGAKRDQQELASLISSTIEQAQNIKKFGIQAIKKNLEFKLLENDIINVFKSIYSTDNAEFQNKVNKPLVTDVAEESASIVAEKLEQSSGQDVGDILSDDTQFELLKGGADGSVAIGISSKGVVSEAQAQRVSHIKPIQLKRIYQVKNKYVVEDRQVKLGGFTSDATIGKNLKTLDGKREVATAHMENQNVHTDNINKGIMAKRNENIHTLPVYVMSTHLGFNETKQPITLVNGKKKHVLLNTLLATQPVIFDYVKEKEKSSLTQEFSADRDLEILNSLIKKYGGNPVNSVNEIESQDYYQDYTEQEMYDVIGTPLEDMSNKEKQLQLEMLRTFMQINDMASQWVEVQNTYNLTTSKLGVSYFETLNKIEKLDKLADRHFDALSAESIPENTINLIGEVSIDKKEGFTKVGQYYWKPTTIEGLQTINSLSIANKIMPIFYPYQKEFFNSMITLAEKSKGENAILSLQNKYDLMAEFTSAVNAQSPIYDIYDGKIDDVRERLFIDSDGNTSLGSFLEQLKESGHRIMENSFLSDLYFDNKKNSKVKRIKHLSSKDSGITPDEKYSDFLSLLESNEPILDQDGENILFNGEPVTTRDIGIDLITYEMLSDDKKGAVSFKNIIPFEYLQAVGVTKYYRDVFRNILDGSTDYNVAYNFIKQYFQHNPTKTSIVEKFPTEGEYAPVFVTKYKGSTPELFEFIDGTYQQIDILETFDTMKQYDLKESNKRDLISKLERNRKEKLAQLSQRKNIKLSVESANKTLVQPKGEPRTLESLITAYKGLKNLSPEQTAAFDIVSKYIDENTTLEWVDVNTIENQALGAYNSSTNTIRIDKNLYSTILERYNPETFDEVKSIAREVIIEELVHATTIRELSKHLTIDGEFTSDTPPLFAQMIKDAYETAKEALPDDYYTSNVDEFVAGMFASPEFRQKLETKLPGVIERIKRAIKNLYNSLIKKSNESIKESYKREFFTAVEDMFKYRDSAFRESSQISDEITDINVNKFKNQRPTLKPGIKTQEPSGNDSQVYNENSIFGDELSQEMIDNIMNNEVTDTDENNNPC